MDGLAKTVAQPAQPQPVNINGQWFYQGVNIPEADAQKIMGVQAAPQQQAVPNLSQEQAVDLIAQAYAEQQRKAKFGQNPIAGAFHGLFGNN